MSTGRRRDAMMSPQGLLNAIANSVEKNGSRTSLGGLVLLRDGI
jgi:hypothetical protein